MRNLAVTGIFLAVTFLIRINASAADKPKDAPKDDKKVAAKLEKATAKSPEKAETTPTIKLPKYYADVAEPKQIEKLNAAYLEYRDRLKKLRDEIKVLTDERNAALDKILTSAQREKMAQLKADAKAAKDK